MIKVRRTFAQKALNNVDAFKSIVNANDGTANDAVAMDAFRNVAARMGYGTASVAQGADYVLERWTNDYWLLITLYRNHWLARRTVERPAQDMCRKWPRLKCDLDPKLISNFDRTIKRTLTPKRTEEALWKGNLFGGAGALIVIDGHEDILDEPLDLDMINPGTYKGLIVFDRWSGITPSNEICNDITRPLDFGLPEWYSVNDKLNHGQFRVHCSRILRFCGPEVPTPELEANMYWGISRLEVIYEELKKKDNMSWTILQLMFRAQILTQVNPELANMLSGVGATGKAAQQFWATYQAQNELLSNNSMLILGKDGKLESNQYSFGGLGEIYQLAQLDYAGAADMPVSLLYGRTTTGLGQTNDADIRNYEQRINRDQNSQMEPQLNSKLYPIICMSEFGEVPDDLDIEFPSIRVLTAEEKVSLAKDGGEYINSTYSAGVISQKTAMEEHKQLSDQTEIMTNISDEDIAEANADVQQPLELEEAELKANAQEETAEIKTDKKPSANDSADLSILNKLKRYFNLQ